MAAEKSSQYKVGLFVFVIIAILAVITLRLSQTSILPGGTYSVYLTLPSATGISPKTPVRIAGIQVGIVSDIRLVESNQAELELEIDKGIKIAKLARAEIKSLGFLGDTYVELVQPRVIEETLADGGRILKSANFGDISSLTGQLSSISSDVKAITNTMKNMMAGEDSSFSRSLRNIEKITAALGEVSSQNQKNVNAIITNLRALSENLNYLVAHNSGNINRSLYDISDITGKIRRGEGTVGRLINDDETVEKLNESIDNLNNLLGSANKLKVDVGYHTEYLGSTEEFKHYVSLKLKPRPDKFFLFEVVQDPSPDSKVLNKISRITSGGVTTTVNEEIETVDLDRFLFSAQLGKQFGPFTLRGGMIESSGGVGIDYDAGLLDLSFSAFDFETKRGEKPHLKAMGKLNLTRGMYLLGGVDDFLNQQQDLDWFVGAGIEVRDDDIKSLIGLIGAKPN